MKSQDFLATVLPSSGVYCAVEVSTAKKEHFFSTSVEDVYNKAIEFSDKGYNAFYALASFDDSKKRLAKNAVKMRSLFLDIDCGEGKDYDSKQAAAAALDTFLSATSLAELGSPWVVTSGGGLHVYWPFTEEVDIDVWKPVAENLKRLAKKEGFNVDMSVTSDAARILRVPDTYNYKEEKPRKVKIMIEADPHQFDFETLKNKIKENLNGSAYELVPRQPIDIPGIPLQATSNGVKLIENTVNKLALVEEKCAQFQYYKDNAASEGMEPLWYAMISVAKKCEDGWDRMVELSEMHPYDLDRLQTKWTQSKGHSPCIKFDSVNPGICMNCPKWQKITTPLQLGTEVMTNEEAAEVIIEDSKSVHQIVLNKPIPPKGFSYGDKGGIYMSKMVDDDDGEKKKVEVMLISYDLFVVDILKENDEHFVHMTAIRPTGVTDIMLPQKCIISKDETLKVLASQNVIATFGAGNDKNLFEYVRGCVEYASTNKLPVKVPANYGWQEDGSFVYNSRIYTEDDKQIFVPTPNLQNINRACIPTGDLNEWRKIYDLFVARKLWDILTLSLVGPASVLMEFTGFNGMTYHIGSPLSGTGKTLSQATAASWWAQWEMYTISADSSLVAVQQRQGLLNSLPVIVDETTQKQRDSLDWLPAYLLAKTQGKGKERMEAGANKERINNTAWKSIDLFSSNTCAYDLLTSRQHASQAEMLRVLDHGMHTQLTFSDAEVSVIQNIKFHYGCAGDKYLRWILANKATVKEVLRKANAALKEEFKASNDERFWSAGNSCILAAAILIGKEYANIVDLPIRPIIDMLKSMVEGGRKAIYGNIRNAEDVLNAYTRENYGKFVVVDSTDGVLKATLGGKDSVDISITRSQVAGRVEHDMTPGHIDYFIEEQQLKAHCVTMSFVYSEFKRQLESMPMYKIRYMKKDMLAKTRGPSMRVNVMHITVPKHIAEKELEQDES